MSRELGKSCGAVLPASARCLGKIALTGGMHVGPPPMILVPLRSCVVLALVFVSLPAFAKRMPPVPCAPGTFAVAAGHQAKVAALVGAIVDAITLDSARAITLGPCAGIASVKPRRH